MTRAYAEMYLDDAMKNLGEAFDYAVNDCNIDIDEFLDLFIASGFAEAFGNGSPKLLSGLSGTELVMETLGKAGIEMNFPTAQTDFEFSPEYWCGWILAYYQWKTTRSFKDIREDISMREVLKLYPTLHEASEDKFVDTLNAIITRKTHSTKLQRRRKLCGYSQRELADRSGVNLRTLQQYELGVKDINKAATSSVMALAKVLGCQAEDIMEYTVAES